MSKKLYVVATPIGNIKEISNYAISVLSEVTEFFCEDTRNSKKLFNLLNISLTNKNFYTLNTINEEEVIKKFNFKNEKYCLLSDAGYPVLSDPGFLLINHFIKNEWLINVVNGPSSLMHSLIVSGFQTKNTLFYGFLSNKKNIKETELNNLEKENKTIVIFESVHRIKETLTLIKKIFDNSNKICVARELTKINETIYRCIIADIDKLEIVEKGEFVIVIDNNLEKDKKSENSNYFKFLNEVKNLILKGEKEKIACKIIAYKYDIKANLLYNFWQQQKNCI
ncbi:MAG: 16S rRNA (cytidine(1402)-2'-O)-methyltransferase [Malacoplasma sp.]|nr:16S rRNA (cytidine(1402)-2'-O)-methyltransferase [Malacoplasma sp.]